MEELKLLNAPPEAEEEPQAQPVPCHPTEEEWEHLTELVEYLCQVEEERLRRESPRQYLSLEPRQMEKLVDAMGHLQWAVEQAGKPKERSFSLPRLSLPTLSLPEWDGPTVAVLAMAAAALVLLRLFLV